MACAFLRRQGFEVLERNYHTTAGEIDIVAKQGGDYYFVEVKTRVAGELANDLAITPSKRRKIEKTVRAYCYRRGIGCESGIILAGLLVIADRRSKVVKFRLAAFTGRGY